MCACLDDLVGLSPSECLVPPFHILRLYLSPVAYILTTGFSRLRMVQKHAPRPTDPMTKTEPRQIVPETRAQLCPRPMVPSIRDLQIVNNAVVESNSTRTSRRHPKITPYHLVATICPLALVIPKTVSAYRGETFLPTTLDFLIICVGIV